MAAETTLLLTLRPGDHVLLADDVYGGTYRLLSKVLGPWGLAFDTCDLTDPTSVRDAVRAETRFVWVETPSNPTLKIVDIEAVSSAAHAAGRRWWSTTRSRRPPRNVRSRSAPTWSCTA
jgi:Cystathionine beta-lyases/cystathionine gamma-synthases